MEVIDTVSGMRAWRCGAAGTVGLVPTMGYLHAGHLSLVRRAREENDTVAVSVFVNPTQFGPTEDLEKYPRDIKRDLDMLEPLADAVFLPTAVTMYPPGYDSWVEVGAITGVLEGAARPGHFSGVTTICAKLFNIVQPARAYFGQKDAQQAAVIKKMVADLDMPLEIVVCPTVREPDGLAMSSRNTYLNPEERQAATVLYRALTLALQRWEGGERDAGKIRAEMTGLVEKEPLAKIDYISIADAATLEELDEMNGPALVSMAVRIGKTRLIDNVAVE